MLYVERSAVVSLDLKALNSYKTKNFRREKMEVFGWKGFPGGENTAKYYVLCDSRNVSPSSSLLLSASLLFFLFLIDFL